MIGAPEGKLIIERASSERPQKWRPASVLPKAEPSLVWLGADG
jgi:hypothetical protein